MTNRPIPPGANGCVCPACHAVFTSVGAFDHHQVRPTRDATTKECRTPEQRGLVVIKQSPSGHPAYGFPISDEARERLAQIRGAA